MKELTVDMRFRRFLRFNHQMKWIVLFLFLLPGSFPAAQAQQEVAPKAQKAFEEGKKFLKKQQPAKAQKAFEKAVLLESNYYDAHAELASLLLRQKDTAALQHLKRIVEIDPAKDPYAWLALARLNRDIHQYPEAISAYQNLLNYSSESHDTRTVALRELADVRFTAHALANPVPFDPVPMAEAINAPGSMQYSPAFTGDNRTIIFTRRVNGQEDFFWSVKSDSIWSFAQPLDAINTNLNEGMQSLSRDGQSMIFTWCHDRQGFGSCDLYVSERMGLNSWDTPKNMGPNLNSPHWDAQPSLSADGQVIIFSSTRPGGTGESDLWWSRKDSTGSWFEAMPLPGKINTSGKEQTPFLHADGSTLYFSSTGHPGMGDFDLYVSRLDSGEGWSLPVNLGYPINTADHEGAMSLGLDGYSAYFATDRVDHGIEGPGLYIYQFQLPDFARGVPVTFVEGYITDIHSHKGLNATIRFKALEGAGGEVGLRANKDGYYMVCLQSGIDYGIQMDHPGYGFYTDHFALSDSSKFKPYRLDVSLEPLSEMAQGDNETRIILRNILFPSGSDRMLPGSEFDLQRMLRFLKEEPSVRIRLEGHTDNIGQINDNLKLSSARARVVMEWLINQGVDASRLESLGFGDQRPIQDNSNSSGRQMNRRTEMVILP